VTLPTADLHVHLEAAISPSLLRTLAQRAGVTLPEGFGPGGFAWRDLTTFVRDYDVLCSVIRSADDYAEVAFDALTHAAASGAAYVDFIVSPAHAWMNEISYAALVDAVGAAIDRATREHGIFGSMSLTAVRAPGPLFGPRNAERIVAEAIAHPHRLVRGLGVAGDTRFDSLADYAPAFRAAKAAGLVTRAHCGEGEGAAGVVTALRELEVDILDHATEALWDDALVEELVRTQRLVTVCPVAHVMVGLVPSLAQHPAWPALRRGLKVALGTDDPVFFRVDGAGTYAQAREHAGLDDGSLLALTRNAARSGLLPADETDRLLARLEAV
jgi:adenosine deaminase